MNIVEPIRDRKLIVKIESVLARKSFRDLLLFVLGTNSGLRISDMLALNVGDVRNKSHIEIKEIKTGKKKKFPIDNKLKQLIQSFTSDKDNYEPLFLSQKNNRLSRGQAYKIIHDVAREVGITYNIGTHSLRKSFGYHHYKQYKDVAILQTILNHSSPSITLKYIGINQDIIDESANDGNRYVARSISNLYVAQGDKTVTVPCDAVNVCRIDNNGKILNMQNLTHEQFLSALLQKGISVPYHQYEMPRIN